MSDRLSPTHSTGQTRAPFARLLGAPALDALRDDAAARPSARRVALACLVVFLLAVGVRLFYWQDTRHDFVNQGMGEEYKAHALALYRGDWRLFVYGPDPPSDANVVKHPPGWPLLSAAVFKIFGPRDAPLRFVNVLLDALAAVLVLLLALEMFPFAAAVLSGLLVAVSPQLAYHAITLVPDPTAVSPLLLGLYLFLRAAKRPRLLTVAAAGVMVGVSCWLRSNALLLPFFLAALVPLLFPRGLRLRPAAVLVATFLAVIAPVTIRNYVAFRSFIPLSLSAGITMIEGIGVYDEEGRFGLPDSDIGVTQWEARIYNRPDYLNTRFSPDGVERERRRVAHGLKIIRENPFWFLRVMTHRAFSMLRLARVELVAAEPGVTNPLAVPEGVTPDRTLPPSQLLGYAGPASAGATNAPADELLRVETEGKSLLAVSPPLDVKPHTDYLLRLPLRIEEGSLVVEVTDARSGARLASTPVLHPVNWAELKPGEQPAVLVKRPFVSGDSGLVRLSLRQGGRRPARVVADVGRAEAFALGPASLAWTRYPRALVRAAQRLFLTATMLPLFLLGALLLLAARRARALALLLVLPVYYMAVQSALWTEFRYVLAMHYPLLILAAVALYWLASKLRHAAARQRKS